MGSVPLAANSINTQQPSPLDEFSRVLGIKSALQGQKMQDLQLHQATLSSQDDDKLRSILADPQVGAAMAKSGDLQPLADAALKQGVGPKALLGLQSAIIDHQQKLATLTKDQLANVTARQDQIRGRVMSIVNAPDDQKQNLWDQEVTNEEKSGSVQPGTFSHQYPGDDVATTFANSHALGSVLSKEAAENTTAGAKQTEATTGANRFAAESNPQSPLYSPTPSAVSLGAANGNPNMQSIQQNQVAQAGAETQAKGVVTPADRFREQNANARSAQIASQLNPNQSLIGVPARLQGPALQEATKLGQSAADSQQAADDMASFTSLARSGNKIAYAYSPVEGVLTLNTGRGVKRVNMSEIGAYGGAGSAADRVQGWLGKNVSGQSIPANILDDMDSLHAQISSNARTRYQRGLDVVNQNYGSHFTPTPVSNSSSNGQGNGATPQSHVFSISAWAKANPGGDTNAAAQAAKQQGFSVTQ